MRTGAPPEVEDMKEEIETGDVEMIPLYVEKKDLKDLMGKVKQIGESKKIEGIANIILACVHETHGNLG